MPGPLTSALDDAVDRGGNRRLLYAQETTLSRRGLRIRARKRAAELARAGIGTGDLVAVALGPSTETLVNLLACDRIGAPFILLDPAAGTRALDELAGALAVAAALRRPAGDDTAPPSWPGHAVRSRRRLAGGLTIFERLEPALERPRPPAGTAYVLPAATTAGAPLFVFRATDRVCDLLASLPAAAGIHEGSAIVAAANIALAPLFETVVIPWIATAGALVLDDAPGAKALATARAAGEPLVALATDREGGRRAAAGALGTVPWLGVGPTRPPAASERSLRQVAYLEEIGPFAVRDGAGTSFRPVAPWGAQPGAPMETGGCEWLVAGTGASERLPRPDEDAPGTPAGVGRWLHTGFAARFEGDGPIEILGRDDGLFWYGGTRGSLEGIERCALSVEGVSACRAAWETGDDGEPSLVLTIAGPADPERVRGFLREHLAPAFVPAAVRPAVSEDLPAGAP